MGKRRIDFTDDELKEALAKYFKIDKDSITFVYVASILNNGNQLEYIDDR